MRRPTAILLVALFLVLVVAAVIQFTQDAPVAPYPGPVSGTPLPASVDATSTISPTPSS
jgi:hypothetical protein